MIQRCLLAFFILIAKISYASDNYPVQYLGIEQGLSNNVVTSIYQDHDGFMWFGTYDGLNRYDGYGFKVYRNIIGDSSSLCHSHINSITGDASNYLWIGTSKGISVFDPFNRRFRTPYFRSFDKDDRNSLIENSIILRSAFAGEVVLAGTDTHGLIYFKRNANIGSQIPLAFGKTRISNYRVAAIEYDSILKKIWVYVPGYGLCAFDPEVKALRVVTPALRTVTFLKAGKKGKVWLGNDDGLFCYDPLTSEYSANKISPVRRVTGFSEDKNGTIWITTDGGGLWILKPGDTMAKAYQSNEQQPSVNSTALYAIFIDEKDRKWIGTLRGGINILYPNTSSFRTVFYNTPLKNNSSNNFINSFCEDDKGNIWVGTSGAGLRYWNRTNNTYNLHVNTGSAVSLSSNYVTGVIKDEHNDLWASTWFNGINRLKSGSGKFERFSCFNPKTNETEYNVWLVYQDRFKHIWASTVNNGTLYTFNRQTNQFEIFDDAIVNVQCLTEDRNGELWAGNYSSLIHINQNKNSHHVYPIGYPVRSIHEDINKNFWIGTEGGGLLLFNRSNGTFQRFTTREGLPNNNVLRILEDQHGILWMSTYNGLCKFDPVSRSFRNFTYADGLQSNQFSFNAALPLRSGEFLFGGIKGFNIFHPDSIKESKEVPRVFLSGLKIDYIPIEAEDRYVTGRQQEYVKQIKVPYDKAILSLDFLALDYSLADKLQYAYQLTGWDKTWNSAGNNRTANYTRIHEGTYVFSVKVMNASGVWGEETRLLQIIILPPWYRSWWAYILYAVFIIGAVYFYILYNKRQERLRYEIKLAHLESEQEKELTEKKISFFTHISHEFRTPLTLIINPLKELVKENTNEDVHKKTIMIHRNAKRLLSLVDQLLLFRKVDSVDQQMRLERFDIVEICNEVFLSFSQHAVANSIDFKFTRNDHDISIYADKEKIEIILFNLVSNAFKYTTQGGKITMEILENEKNIEISIKDTGSGIPADVGNKLFDSFYRADSKDMASQTGFGVGLYVSHKLAVAHHGKLSYSSEQNAGTEFRLMLLKGKEHFGSQHIISEDYKRGQTILHELVEEPLSENVPVNERQMRKNKSAVIDRLTSDLPTMLIVDDNAEIRSYIRTIFTNTFNIYEADDGTSGYELTIRETPDIIISDIMMKKIGGIELCQKIKDNPSIAHIPVILLTASSSDDIKLKGIKGGAEDYITKPFDKEIIVARVQNILKGKNRLQQYFFNAVTLKPNSNIAGEHKEFIERCIAIVENHLDNPAFSIQTFCKEIGMSHPGLYKKVKAVSGLTVNVFVRYLRLRKAAELLITTDKTIAEITYITGFNDIRYFREQFSKLFEMKPSEYVKRYRKVLGNKPVSN